MSTSAQRITAFEPENRRRHERLACGGGLQVQVLSLTQGLNPDDKTVTGAATDVSAGGLSLRVDRPLPVGHILDLWVRVRRREGAFMLTGQVKWVMRNAGGEYSVGVQLLDKPTDDVKPWLRIIKAALRQQEA